MQKRSHINFGASVTIPAGTEVNVYTDAACTILATIYANDGVTPTDNPVIVDANGEFSYRAANGIYFEKIGAEPAAELRFDDGSGYSLTSHNHSGVYLNVTATVYPAQTASFTIAADMLGKDVPVTFTDGIITLPAFNEAGFGNGFQCKIVNLSASTKTYSGTVIAAGTKQPTYSSRVVEIINNSWFIGGLTT